MRHVAILIETSRAYGRGLLRGIARYNCEHSQWSTFFQPQGLGDPAPAWLPSWRGDGILARIDNRQVAQAVQKAGVPVVNTRGTLTELPFHFIGSDNSAIAELAAEHLLERGFRHFAFCGYLRRIHPKLDLRGDCFQQLIKQAGYHCERFQNDTPRRPRSWEQQQTRIASWIAELPKPIGILAANDVLATNDEDLVRAIRFIREHACRPIMPDDVVQHVRISRSSLESRCHSVTGRSLHQEIRKVQLDKARTLLTDTDLPIKQVAIRAGFKNVQYLTRVFRRTVGQPPAAFRRGRVS